MQYALIKNTLVENVIEADLEFIDSIADQWDHIEPLDTLHEQGLGVGINWTFENGEFTPPPAPPAPEPVTTWVITRNALQNRFPITANGVSTKYDLATLFLNDAGYAASLGVTGADLYSQRTLLITANNRLGVVTSVNLQAQETIDYMTLMQSPVFPEVFRLTQAEADAILNTPAASNETP